MFMENISDYTEQFKNNFSISKNKKIYMEEAKVKEIYTYCDV